ncbi:hypothetical protein B0H19DRAFT_1081520 [Mycena capillaripes]|nr:hypothetical protein B0H19DRAFT_1081520 [Mycena capillaripes]
MAVGRPADGARDAGRWDRDQGLGQPDRDDLAQPRPTSTDLGRLPLDQPGRAPSANLGRPRPSRPRGHRSVVIVIIKERMDKNLDGKGKRNDLEAPTRPLNGTAVKKTAVFVDGTGLPGRQRRAGEPRDGRVPPVPSVTAVFDGCWRTRCARRVTRRTRQTGGNGYPVNGSTRPVPVPSCPWLGGLDGRVKTRPSRPSTRQKRGRVGALHFPKRRSYYEGNGHQIES